MKKNSVAIFALIIVCFFNRQASSIGSEFTLITKFGGVIREYYYPPGNLFDCQLGFGYSAIFKKAYIKIDGEILYSLSELKTRKTTKVVGLDWDDVKN